MEESIRKLAFTVNKDSLKVDDILEKNENYKRNKQLAAEAKLNLVQIKKLREAESKKIEIQ